VDDVLEDAVMQEMSATLVLFKLPVLQFIRLVFLSGAKNIAPIWNLLIVSLDSSKLVLANLISLMYR
jgi:hypothetical protein